MPAIMPHVIFDFPEGPHTRGRAVFGDPTEIVSVRHLAEVRPALKRVQEAVRLGMHAAGFVAYEAAPAFEPAMRVRPPGAVPLLWFGLFHEPAIEPGSPAGEPSRAAAGELDWRPEDDAGWHADAVARVRSAIAEGRSYQANLTTRLRARTPHGFDPLALYERMRRAQATGYHAFIDIDTHAVVSASPELFFRVRGREILTRPMKGTRPRGRWPEEDARLREELASSDKDRAENLMIVDLLRNDLGRVCETGSVRVPALFDIERYPTVWQMTSAVAGRLPHGADLDRLFEALFPCGSVTGAPKISTMDLLADLERSPRGVYCGAIGWLEPGGDCTFSVPIRTTTFDRAAGTVEYGTGGGIVWDSTPDDEYQELLTKALVVRTPWPEFSLFETLRLEEGRFVRLERHLRRLRRSAGYFGFPFPEAAIRDELAALGRSHEEGAFRARLVLHPFGTVRVEATAAGETGPGVTDGAPARVALSPSPVDSGDPFLFHKTTRRDVYDVRRDAAPAELFDVLLQNERGEATEFTRGNLVVEMEGERVTPPLAAGLLPGCFREQLVEEGEVRERSVLVEELARASRLWFVNSLREWVEVRLL